MLFTEARFLAFFAVVFVVHWALRGNTARKLWLLACSYLFYAGWDWRFLGLILASTLVDYCAGLALAGPRPPRARRLWLLSSLAVNLGILGLFKYYDFFVESGRAFLTTLGVPVSDVTLRLVLPVGISFYTFQTLSYTLDVFRNKLEPTRHPVDFALFVAFFPQLVAGPIVRASEFLPQLRRRRELAEVAMRSCLTLFLVGFIKKACIADNIAPLVDPVFAAPTGSDPATLWLSLILFSVQIYCDFSGYTDMAIAVGGLLGYRLPLNFDHPYVATSLRGLWRRWHISLTTWLRDYLYIPLGGNRGSTARVYLNLFTVFVLSGLWHGASWNFVLWGVVQGLGLTLERLLRRRDIVRLGGLAGILWAQFAWAIGWTLFRTADLATAWAYLRSLFWLNGGQEAGQSLSPVWWLLVLTVTAVHFADSHWAPLRRLQKMPDLAFAAAYGAACALTLPWAAAQYEPFIYFQF